MGARERIEAFWSGDRPDRIPYTIYDWEWRHTADDPRWQPLFDLGLAVTWHIPTVKRVMPGLHVSHQSWQEDGHTVTRRTLQTEGGDLFDVYVDGWQRKFLLETADDYRVMTDLLRAARLEPVYDDYRAQANALGPHGIPLIDFFRTPNQTILVDYVGLENYALHLFDFEAELLELYDVLFQQFRQAVQLVAEGPGRYVCVLENFTAETLGPHRYRQLLQPVYEACFPVLRDSGKIVGVHYDGKLASCKALIAKVPLDVIESLTPPPEGDLSLAEARSAWPGTLFWSNINIACYQLPPHELRSLIAERVTQGAPDGRRLAFEVSEHLPLNWYDSMRVVLETLRDLSE